MNNISHSQFDQISNLALGASIGSAFILDDDDSDQKLNIFVREKNSINDQNTGSDTGSNFNTIDPSFQNLQSSQNAKKEVSLWSFTRMYRLGGIPIMDFIIGYIFLYSFNKLVLKCDTKLMIFSIIPLVVLVNIMCNPSVKITWFIIGIMILSIYFLVKIE